MAAPTRRELEREPLGPDQDRGGERFLVVELYYAKGGPNYFSGGTDPRGYWISVIPTTVTPDGVRSFALTAGVRALIEPAARFSPKRFADVQVAPDLLAGMKARVLAQEQPAR
jgi:hypothetical protein